MNVYGQLVAAQLENLSAAPAGVPAGRVYFDTTLHSPRFYDNNASAWKTIADLTSTQTMSAKTLTTCAGITLNASAAIDWAAGSVTIGGSIGANTLTLGGASTTVRVPGALSYGTATLDGDDFVLNNDAAGSGADWKITLHRPTSGMTADATITLPNATSQVATLALTETFTNKTLTSPKINENVALTTTATKLNYLTSATGTTGTTSTNIVFSTSPTIATPAFTGDWTGTGNHTTTKSGAIAWLLNNTSTTGDCSIELRSGNGTTSSNNRYIMFGDNDSSQQSWQIGHVGSNNLNFYNQTAGHSSGSIDNTDAWLIGPSGVYTASHQVNGTFTVYGAASGPIQLTSTSTSTYTLTISTDDTGAKIKHNSSSRDIRVTANTLGVQLNAGGTSWGSLSDLREKRNVVDIGYGLAEVLKLKPIFFNYNIDEEGTPRRMGFGAQDVQAIFPEIVHQDNEGKLSLEMLLIVPSLTKALQELNAKFEAYKAAHP